MRPLVKRAEKTLGGISRCSSWGNEAVVSKKVERIGRGNTTRALRGDGERGMVSAMALVALSLSSAGGVSEVSGKAARS